MARFHDMIAEWLAADPEGRPDNIYDDLTAEYDGLYDGGVADRDAHTAALEAKDAEIAALKAKNYDLLMAAGDGGSRDEEDAEDELDDAAEDDGDAIDSLFKNAKDDN